MLFEVDRQLMVDTFEPEPATADPPGPRHHREAAPTGCRQCWIVTDDQRHRVDNQRGHPSAVGGADGARGGACSEFDHGAILYGRLGGCAVWWTECRKRRAR